MIRLFDSKTLGNTLFKCLPSMVLAIALTFSMAMPGALAQSGTTGTIQGQVNETVTTPNSLPADSLEAAKGKSQAILDNLIKANNIPANSVQNLQMVDDKELNAATNGKAILFTLPMWNALNTADQRAFVISHELAHIRMNHVPKAQARQIGAVALDYLLLRKLFGTGAVASQAKQVGLALAEMRFSRQAEYGADDLGLQMMEKAGYQPRAALETLAVLDKLDTSGTPQFLRTHPLSRSRIQALATKYPQKNLR